MILEDSDLRGVISCLSIEAHSAISQNKVLILKNRQLFFFFCDDCR